METLTHNDLPARSPDPIIAEMASPVEQFEDGRNAVHFNFLLYNHQPEYSREVADALEDSDVIAIELATDNQSQRQEAQQIANAVTHAEQGAQAAIAMKSLSESGLSEFQQKLFGALIGSGKEVVFVDINKDQDEAKDQVGALEYLGVMRNHLWDGSSLETVTANLSKAIDLQASAASKRETVVADQIKEIIEDRIDRGQGTNIAVLQGMVHTSTSHIMSREGYDVQRSFIPGSKIKGLKTLYSYWQEGFRKREYSPDQPLSQEFLNRTLLEWYCKPIQQKMNLPSKQAEMSIRLAIDRLSDTDVNDLLETVHVISVSKMSEKDKIDQTSDIIARRLTREFSARSNGQ